MFRLSVFEPVTPIAERPVAKQALVAGDSRQERRRLVGIADGGGGDHRAAQRPWTDIGLAAPALSAGATAAWRWPSARSARKPASDALASQYVG